jgi:HSP20 family molecular chaperone IbpA
LNCIFLYRETQENVMNQKQQQNQQSQQNQQNQQASQVNKPAYQPGQSDPQPSQSSQDNRFGGYTGAGQDQSGRAQGQPGQAQGREVTSAGQQGGQLSRTQPTTTVLPPVDIYEDDSGFTVVADLPGVSKEQLVVRVTGDNLLIEGSASVPTAGNMELVYGEVQSPQYRRSFTLSRELDPGKIEAKLSNGVLRLRIPKAEEAKPRRIEVSVG